MWRRDPWNGRVSEGPRCTQRNGEEWRSAGCVYLAQREIPGFLITVFPKNEKENLPMAERDALKKRAIVFSTRTGSSMKTQFEQMMDGLDDVEAFLAGEQEGFKAYVPQEVDVKAIRNRLGMTQAKFSDTFGFSLDAIKHWEGGRRKPEAPARTLLTVIDKNPASVLAALNPAAFAAAVGTSKPTTVHVSRRKNRHAPHGNAQRNAYSAGGKRITK
jgi:putative transcriptional regulator